MKAYGSDSGYVAETSPWWGSEMRLGGQIRDGGGQNERLVLCPSDLVGFQYSFVSVNDDSIYPAMLTRNLEDLFNRP